MIPVRKVNKKILKGTSLQDWYILTLIHSTSANLFARNHVFVAFVLAAGAPPNPRNNLIT
jgi:hypothetical protein